MNSILRFEFKRDERVKYVSHLDFLRTFQRALKRAKLPLYYSKGFNPHPDIVFGLPLGVGITGEKEYVDVGFCKHIKPEETIELLNNTLPGGIKILNAKIRKSKKNIMADIAFASYELIFIKKDDYKIDIYKAVKDFNLLNSIKILKKTKRKEKEIDIKNMIISFEIKDTFQNAYIIKAYVSAGSENNLKPDLLAEAFVKYSGDKPDYINIKRTGLYVKRGDIRICPLESKALEREE